MRGTEWRVFIKRHSWRGKCNRALPSKHGYKVYACLAHDHQVSSYRDYIHYIHCRRARHREQQCLFWTPFYTRSFFSLTAQCRQFKHGQSWEEFVAMPPVDTVFCTCQNDQSGLIGRGKLLCTLTADENQLVKMVADEWWWSMERLI